MSDYRKLEKLAAKRRRLRREGFKLRQELDAIAGRREVVVDAIRILSDKNLVWDNDFDKIRKSLVLLLTMVDYTGLHDPELVSLCKAIVC